MLSKQSKYERNSIHLKENPQNTLFIVKETKINNYIFNRWKLNVFDLEPFIILPLKMGDRIALSPSLLAKGIMMLFCFFLFDTKIYIFFSSQPPEIRLTIGWADFFGLILAKSFFSQLEKSHSTCCGIIQMIWTQASQGRDLLKLSRGVWKALTYCSLPHIEFLLWCLRFFFHILILFNSLEDYGWPVGILIKARAGDVWI